MPRWCDPTEGAGVRDGDGAVTVRPAHADDAEALATAHVRAWQVGYRGMMPQDYLDGIDLDERIAQWRGWVADGRFVRTRLVVAEVAGVVAGFAIHGPERVPDDDAAPASTSSSAGAARSSSGGGATPSSGGGDGPEPATGELYALNVHPDRWGGGVGSVLLGHVHAALADAGHREAVLWVVPQNERARRFYARHGWAPDGAAKTDTVQGVTVDEVRYRRRLP